MGKRNFPKKIVSFCKNLHPMPERVKVLLNFYKAVTKLYRRLLHIQKCVCSMEIY